MKKLAVLLTTVLLLCGMLAGCVQATAQGESAPAPLEDISWTGINLG